MLILTRKLGESIAIGDDIKVVILDIKGKQVRIGVQAPRQTKVHREELYQVIMEQNRISANSHSIQWEEILAKLKNGIHNE